MNKCYATILLAALVTGISATAADAAFVTLTFDDLTPQSLNNGDSFTLDGYTIDILSANWAITDPGDGDNALGATGDESMFVFHLRRSDGEAFEISSFDLLLEGDILSADVVFIPDDINNPIPSNPYGTTTGFETKTNMPPGLFTEVQFSISVFDPGEVYVDNFVVTAIPEPASAALLGLGGVATLCFRRRAAPRVPRDLEGRYDRHRRSV
jgi:hypothetical protein